MLKTHRPTAAPTLARTMTGEEDGQELLGFDDLNTTIIYSLSISNGV